MKKKSNNVKDVDKSEKKLIELLNDILKKYSIAEIADKINLTSSTVNRWIELKNIPKTYEFDLLKLLSIKIDYSQYTSKEKAQFFTPVTTAKYCYDTFCKVIKDLGENESLCSYIEPSAGDGSFLKVLPIDRTFAMDIEPKNENISVYHFLH